MGKKPKGRVCSVCLSTFRALGWDAVHVTIGQYFKFAATPAGRAKHQEFLQKRKILRDKVDVSGHHLRGDHGKKVIGTTELELVKSRGRKITKPQRDFVMLNAWDEKSDL